MLTLGAKTIKYFLFFINLIYVITGIILICIGAAIKAKYTDFQHIMDHKLNSISIFLIIIGFIIFVISFWGCCGAVTENRCMILLFSVSISIILILEVCLAVGGYVFSREAEQLVTNTFKDTLAHYRNNTEIEKEWDMWQTNLDCCGISNYTDWTNANLTIPWSCCAKPGGSNSTECKADSLLLHHNGCFKALADLIKSEAEGIGNATLVLAVIHLLSIFGSCYLAKAIKTSQYESV